MLAIVIPSYNSASCLINCIDSLKKGVGHEATLVLVVENGDTPLNLSSPESYLSISITGNPSFTNIKIIQNSHNSGFAGAVNLGITRAFQEPEVTAAWILNPDCIAFPTTALKFYEESKSNDFLGGRVLYQKPFGTIQMDFGYASSWTGVTSNANLGKKFDSSKADSTKRNSFPSGANMVISRKFFERVGALPEDNFLYYEEVSWSKASRGLSKSIDIDAVTLHDAGHSIGSRTLKNAPSRTASYFMNRARLNFIRRHHPARLPFAYLYSAVRSVRSQFQFGRRSSLISLLGTFGLPIPTDVKSKVQGR